jgi:hypothetical protein
VGILVGARGKVFEIPAFTGPKAIYDRKRNQKARAEELGLRT